LDNKINNFDSLQVDILREIANIGTGHAANALGTLLGKTIIQSVPKVKLIPIYEMQDVLGGPEKVVTAGMLRLSGDISGYLLIIFNLSQADRIISLMMGRKPVKRKSERKRFSALDKSVLNETFNIMSGSYLTAVASFTNMVLHQSTPFFCMDMVGAVLNTASAEIGKSGDYAIFFESELFSENETINSDLILIPDEGSCNKLLESLGLL
jgi:chemotaxis protein CheC